MHLYGKQMISQVKSDTRLWGMILMGGLNTRMGGQKKALLRYQGKCFYEHVRDAIRSAGVEQIYASVDKTWPALGDMPQIVDNYHAIGPVGGIASALEWMCGYMPSDVKERTAPDHSRSDALLVVPCDLPLICPVLLEALIREYHRKQLPVVLTCEGRVNPLVAIYTRECLPVLQAQIKDGNYKASYCLENMECGEIAFEDLGLDEKVIANINSRDVFEQLEV